MPRGPRKKSASGIYHIILRGINRQSIYEDDGDRKRFLLTLKRYKSSCGYSIYAYCLMDNHLHLLLREGEEPLEQILRRLAGSYVYWFNKKYDRTGNLFQDRYKSEPVEDDTYLLTVSRYIHQNPLKAGMVKNTEDYPWSSYHDYLGGKGVTDTGFILNILDADRNAALRQFRRFTAAANQDKCLEIKEPGTKVTDDMLEDMITKKYNLKAARIGDEPREKMAAILREILKIDGVSTRQLVRVTGISAGIIWRL